MLFDCLLATYTKRSQGSTATPEGTEPVVTGSAGPALVRAPVDVSTPSSTIWLFTESTTYKYSEVGGLFPTSEQTEFCPVIPFFGRTVGVAASATKFGV